MARIVVKRKSKRDIISGDTGNGSAADTVNVNDTDSGENFQYGESESIAVDNNSTGNDNRSGSTIDADGTKFVSPTNATGGSSDGIPKRRGRKPGSKNRAGGTSPRSATQTSQDISVLLFSLHLGVAAIFKSPGFAITPDESEKLGDAITRVTELYDISVLPEKTIAWINLAMVAGTIYGPRMMTKKSVQKSPKGEQS